MANKQIPANNNCGKVFTIRIPPNNPLIFLILSKTGRVANYFCIITCIFNNEIIKNKTMSMYWILFIGIAVISYIVQNSLQSKFKKYSKMPLASGMTGKDVAEKMLHDNGIYDVRVTSTPLCLIGCVGIDIILFE